MGPQKNWGRHSHYRIYIPITRAYMKYAIAFLGLFSSSQKFYLSALGMGLKLSDRWSPCIRELDIYGKEKTVMLPMSTFYTPKKRICVRKQPLMHACILNVFMQVLNNAKSLCVIKYVCNILYMNWALTTGKTVNTQAVAEVKFSHLKSEMLQWNWDHARKHAVQFYWSMN